MTDATLQSKLEDALFIASYRSSSTLEKILEHRIIADLSSHFWLSGIDEFEISRSEVDAYGYDLVVEVGNVIRHIQLKMMRLGAAKSGVNISLRLARKPSGCVVWMVYDPKDLTFDHFLWFGSSPGAALPPLGDKVAKHTKSNSQGEKTERSGHRTLAKTKFAKLADVKALAGHLFGPSLGLHATQRSGSADTVD